MPRPAAFGPLATKVVELRGCPRCAAIELPARPQASPTNKAAATSHQDAPEEEPTVHVNEGHVSVGEHAGHAEHVGRLAATAKLVDSPRASS